MKVLSAEEITKVDKYLAWSDFDLNDDFERLLHTAREYHRLRRALERIDEHAELFNEGDVPEEIQIASEALKDDDEK